MKNPAGAAKPALSRESPFAPINNADKPTKAQCMREAGAVFAAALIRIERERLMSEMASESGAVLETGNPTRNPHNSPQSTKDEQIQTRPKPA